MSLRRRLPYRLALLTLLLGLVGTGRAQSLPPPGGWPLRPVAELRAVPEPPGGLVPYRAGRLWGFADTTGRVWIRPVFPAEPPRLLAGRLLVQPLAGQLVPCWNLRYGRSWGGGDGQGEPAWGISVGHDALAPAGPAQLLNARGELVAAEADEPLVLTADGVVRARPRARCQGAREVVALAGSTLVPDEQQLVTVRIGPLAPECPRWLQGRQHFELVADFTTAGQPRYLARQVNWRHPTQVVWRARGCYGLRSETEPRYLHDGRCALFNQQGHRLTKFNLESAHLLLPGHLAYAVPVSADSTYFDERAADNAGLPQASWVLRNDASGGSCRYGLLDLRGRALTPPCYLRMAAAGPNAIWVVAVRHQILYYGLLDTLGHYRLPLRPAPLSGADAAGLLRQRGSRPVARPAYSSATDARVRYADTATVRYLRAADGRPAFAGRFEQASGFWRGRALVRQGGQFGIIDTLGRWVLPLQPETLRFLTPGYRHREQLHAGDPFHLFDRFAPAELYGVLPDDSALVLTHGPAGYGLRGLRTGQVVVPATFSEEPGLWHGAAVGRRQGWAWAVSSAGQGSDPDQPATTWPAGVSSPAWPLLTRTSQGYRTRGGRLLWQD